MLNRQVVAISVCLCSDADEPLSWFQSKLQSGSRVPRLTIACFEHALACVVEQSDATEPVRRFTAPDLYSFDYCTRR